MANASDSKGPLLFGGITLVVIVLCCSCFVLFCILSIVATMDGGTKNVSVPAPEPGTPTPTVDTSAPLPAPAPAPSSGFDNSSEPGTIDNDNDNDKDEHFPGIMEKYRDGDWSKDQAKQVAFKMLQDAIKDKKISSNDAQKIFDEFKSQL